MESECQEGATSGHPNANVAMLDISETEVLRFEAICRLCANHSEKIIGIYSEEGISNGLPTKMNLYLPVKVAEGDSLPLQCCWSCASTILAWHELVVTSVEADRRLREIQIVANEQLQSNEDAKISLSPEHEKSVVKHEDDKVTTQHSDAYECETCGINFATETLLSAHKMRGHKRRKRRDIDYNIFCDICNKGFTRRFDMEKHRKSKHPFFESSKPDGKEEDESKIKEEEPSFSCRVCEAKFEKYSSLKTHEKKVHGILRLRRKQGEIVGDYFCDVCNKGFTRRHDMAKHRKKQHPNQEPLPGNKTDERASFLQDAKVTGPDGETFYKCKTCERVFKQSYNLMRHQTKHTGVRAYYCHICGKNYPSSNGLKRHIDEHHFGVKKFACEVCGKRFAASATRNEHLNIHTDTRPFVCDVCGKTFKQKASLHTHKLFHTNIFKFSCSVCDRKFRRNTELKVHTWLHTGHKPHKCHLCAASFRLRKDLRKHIRVHDKLNECVCSECGMIFSQQKYLTNHKKSHKSAVVKSEPVLLVKNEPVVVKNEPLEARD